MWMILSIHTPADLAIRAVHVEVVFGYDNSSFLMALSRFASVCGWPETISVILGRIELEQSES